MVKYRANFLHKICKLQRYSNCPHLWLTTLQPLSTFCLSFVKCKKFKTTSVRLLRDISPRHRSIFIGTQYLNQFEIHNSYFVNTDQSYSKWLQCVRFKVWTTCLLHVIHVNKGFFKIHLCFLDREWIGQYRFHHLTENVRLTSARWDNFARQ